MIGAEVAQDYLCYVLQTTASGLLKGQSVALIRDQLRAELFNHFRSAEQRLLANAARHAGINWRQFHLISGIASHLEAAADALLRASLMLRDHVLGEVMFM